MGVRAVFRVQLQETGTLELYYQENTSVHEEDTLAPILTSQWTLYHQKRDSGRVRAREMTSQTPPRYTMDKTTQKSATLTKNNSCMATQWSMYDEYHAHEIQEKKSEDKVETSLLCDYYLGDLVVMEADDMEGEGKNSGGGGNGGVSGSRGRSAGGGGSSRREREERGGGGVGGRRKGGVIDVNEDTGGVGVGVGGLLRGLGWVERQLSSTHNIHLLHAYTDYRAVISRQHHHDTLRTGRGSEKRGGRGVEGCKAEELWTFTSSSTTQRRVNHVSFCCNSQWLVMAGYGEPSFNRGLGGLVCGWSAKRIGQPEVRLEETGAVTVVSCCPTDPQLCCVALLDGALRVYQLDTPSPTSLMDTSGSVYKHCGPVWAVEWRLLQPLHTHQQQNVQDFVRAALVSASEDGTVKEWLIGGQGTFRCTTLMKVCLPPWASLEIVGGLKEVLKTNRVGEDEAKVVSGGEKTKKSGSGIKERMESGGGRREKLRDKMGIPENAIREKTETNGEKIGTNCEVPEKTAAGSEGKEKTDSSSGGGGGKTGTRGEKTGGSGQLLPDAVPATSLKFRPGDPTSYLVGTVAGHLLVCRTFERRGSISVFWGHSGLVTALDWRPGSVPGEPASVFLSAALDDSIRVWHLDKQRPHCILKNPQASSGPGGYVDACWCPWYGNLVAGVHGGGLHLWDISLSTHTPALTHPVTAATCVAFSPHTKNVVVGDREGSVRVIHLEGITVTSSTTFQRFSSMLSRISMLGAKDEQDQE